MVNLVHLAPHEHTPATTAWVLAISYSIAIASLVVLLRTLAGVHRHRHLYSKLVAGAAGSIPIALAAAALRPRPELLLLTLALLLTAVWWASVFVWLRSDATVRSWPPGLHDGE